VIHPHHNRTAWDTAIHAAGLEGLNEILTEAYRKKKIKK